MKSANLIVEHIKNLPQFKLIDRYYCSKKFVSLLSPRLQKAIEFSYLKDNVFYIAISHPGYKMELYSKIEYLKSILSKVGDLDDKCKNFKESRIVIINSKLKNVRETSFQDTNIYYEERSKGGFDIDNIKDEDLKKTFKKIREHIINGAN